MRPQKTEKPANDNTVPVSVWFKKIAKIGFWVAILILIGFMLSL